MACMCCLLPAGFLWPDFAEPLAPSTWQEARGSPSPVLGEAAGLGALGPGGSSAAAGALPGGPHFSLSCRSQLLVDTDSCCCLSVAFALFCFNLSTSLCA